ncbi:hypothetical protein DPMN_114303 [Dreissena polymorpha]|uniref:Uncharacterized protein n=1 Tax=Dreissena polymorpha TaxID=45954 RepID=A0A9D4KJM4_DREPO|nr:hypothetical protein DPMN_114273 [Dreissena polymorpha]KAH3840846.1 hypothetical protein DPMN_114303 [Dreissena polymorpha]
MCDFTEDSSSPNNKTMKPCVTLQRTQLLTKQRDHETMCDFTEDIAPHQTTRP